jgi:hypothetical protein
MSKSVSNINTGKQLYMRVKGGFVAKGTSLNAWCRANEVNPTNARAALMGSWSGPTAKNLCLKLLKDSDIAPHQHRAA